MVIKGYACGNGKRVAAHLLRTDTNERVSVLEVRGTTSENLFGAFGEMEAVAAGTRCMKPLYHASINTRVDERLTPEQVFQSVDALEEALGFTGQPRAIVMHVKNGREHYHIVWSRTDIEHMRALRIDHNYRTHEIVARQLEKEFGHERVQGAHVERDGPDGKVPRPERTPNRKEMAQVERGGMHANEAKAHITALWQGSDSGKSFIAGLEQSGWLLAQGDRRDFVVIDPGGGVHSLARRVEGARVKDIAAKMAGIDPQGFLNVVAAKQVQEDRRNGIATDYDQRLWEDRLREAALKKQTAEERQQQQYRQMTNAKDEITEHEPEEPVKRRRWRTRDSEARVATSNASMAAQQDEANDMFRRRQKAIDKREGNIRPHAPGRGTTGDEKAAKEAEDIADKLPLSRREILMQRFMRKAASDMSQEQERGQGGDMDGGMGGGDTGGPPGGGGSR